MRVCLTMCCMDLACALLIIVFPKVAKRNADFSEIVRLLKLRDSPLTDITTSTFHHVFWMGDLNYRISINKNLCVDLIKDNKWDDLNKMDQLVNEKATGKVLPRKLHRSRGKGGGGKRGTEKEPSCREGHDCLVCCSFLSPFSTALVLKGRYKR